MTWLDADASGATPFQQLLGLRPELQPLVNDYLAAAWAASDPVVLELCRLRIAALHGDRAQQRLRHDTAVAAGLTEQQVAALPHHHDSPLFTDHQRRCVAYAEQYVIDVHGISEDQAAAIRTETGDDGFVAFTVALGLFDGMGRMRLALGLDDEPPADTTPVLVPTPRHDAPAH
jgi:alkylhydroperoxidase family enzyme